MGRRLNIQHRDNPIVLGFDPYLQPWLEFKDKDIYATWVHPDGDVGIQSAFVQLNWVSLKELIQQAQDFLNEWYPEEGLKRTPLEIARH